MVWAVKEPDSTGLSLGVYRSVELSNCDFPFQECGGEEDEGEGRAWGDSRPVGGLGDILEHRRKKQELQKIL